MIYNTQIHTNLHVNRVFLINWLIHEGYCQRTLASKLQISEQRLSYILNLKKYPLTITQKIRLEKALKSLGAKQTDSFFRVFPNA
jgi:hypothetical protein